MLRVTRKWRFSRPTQLDEKAVRCRFSDGFGDDSRDGTTTPDQAGPQPQPVFEIIVVSESDLSEGAESVACRGGLGLPRRKYVSSGVGTALKDASRRPAGRVGASARRG